MNESIANQQKIIRFYNEGLHEIDDEIAVEFPLTIVVDGEELATMVCTPTQIEELVVGFLASEGLIRVTDEILSMSIDRNRGFAYVELKNKKTINKDFYSKRFIGSCCGKSRQFYLHNDARTAKTVMSKTNISVEQCFSLMKQMQERSLDFQRTGGVHNAALCTPNELLIERSDIGRHNALDKIYGYCLQERISSKDKIIVFSGRISSEVLLKVAKIGIGIILSKSAPTTLAIELAQDLGITAVGFIRGSALNIYSHPQRIVDANIQ
ncbi:formate dehydrogenase accessory sulfurtransferase FdhD [Ammoniphilus sp. CFH 90114]|uniref:formate dehydrogenase accessory sulfurtransferase FdhD n=1 Tax=Ammoniphilus sp. CFH 90114 TaxID=2493665 RepID=UPI00100F5FB9|nr:formate dehydrogenase accessory sulfurtransferase FdhD [Ammoniphilus sp. CFH 90114]RXT06441.1 formate dehydrogenase accessory sulfurtransferase FdhD [Ammoniphilus sp. CFH 90114]